MNLNIAENLRRLRNANGVTQKQVADSLGVSFQAVSKWESGDGYPDITLILPLAAYFGVTADAILGKTNESESGKRRIEEIHSQTPIITYNTDNTLIYVKRIDLFEQAYKDFPNDYDILIEYARELLSDHRIDGVKFDKNDPIFHYDLYKKSAVKNGALIERICDRIRNECSDERRQLANKVLVTLYRYRGDRDKMAAILDQEFSEYPTSKNIALLDSFDDRDSNILQYKKVYHELFNSLILHLQRFPEEFKLACEKTLALCDAFFDGGEYGAFAETVICAAANLSWHYSTDAEKSVMYLRKAFETAKYFDNLYRRHKDGQPFIYAESSLVRGLELDTSLHFEFENAAENGMFLSIIESLEYQGRAHEPHIAALIEEFRPRFLPINAA